MKQASFRAMLNTLINMGGMITDDMLIPRSGGFTPKSIQKFHPRKFAGIYKPSFSMGFRGFERKTVPNGTYPAPTIDQVRNIERKYNIKLHVKRGLMYFANTNTVFDPKLVN
jgi:hypothetical protein